MSAPPSGECKHVREGGVGLNDSEAHVPLLT